MSQATNYLENKVLDHILGTAAYTMPTVYLGLFTATPSDTGGGTEVSGNAYARQACPFSVAVTNTGSLNSGTVTFPTASGSWGTITHWALFDAVTTGNMLVYGALASSRTIALSDTLIVNPGGLTVTLD